MNKEINPLDAAKLKEVDPNTVFLDVREDSELAICRIEGALHIPMGQIPAQMEHLSKDTHIVVFCHHGMRSMHVIQFLESQGWQNVSNLAGGIHAWSLDVDAEVAQY